MTARCLVLAVGLAAAVSCGSSPPEAADCAAVREKLLACGAIGEGAIFCDDGGDFDRCVNACTVRSSCGDVRRERCVGERTGAQQQCIDRCLDELRLFRCRDGQSVRWEAHCDGAPDCDDESDEVGCAFQPFSCDDGSAVGSRVRCDGRDDCPDGSDERGCAETICPEGVTPVDPFA